jgi:hypothetical protein
VGGVGGGGEATPCIENSVMGMKRARCWSEVCVPSVHSFDALAPRTTPTQPNTLHPPTQPQRLGHQHPHTHTPCSRNSPPGDAWGYVACTGTNFCLRARALGTVGWFPEYTITEGEPLRPDILFRGRGHGQDRAHAVFPPRPPPRHQQSSLALLSPTNLTRPQPTNHIQSNPPTRLRPLYGAQVCRLQGQVPRGVPGGESRWRLVFTQISNLCWMAVLGGWFGRFFGCVGRSGGWLMSHGQVQPCPPQSPTTRTARLPSRSPGGRGAG